MKKQILLSLVLTSSLFATAANAQEESQQSNTSTLKTSDVQKSEEKMGGDVDDEITNAKMRAESGSKSKWSMTFDLTYNGGNLEDPLGEVRPNYSGTISVDDKAYLDGTVEGTLRLDKNSRISFGTGVSVLTPLQSTGDELMTSSDAGGSTEVATPYVSYGYAGRIVGIQSSVSASYSHATSQYDVNTVNLVGSVGASYTALFDMKDSNWQPGMSFSIGNRFFSDAGANSYDYYLAAYPFAEYAFNDRYSFRTVFRPFTFLHLRAEEDGATFFRDMYTQSVGLGIAVNRDLYFYPNMQFAPENLTAELTNVGLTMTANIF